MDYEMVLFMIKIIESQPYLPGVIVAEMVINNFKIARNSNESVEVYDVACKMKNWGITAYLRLREGER